MSVYSSNRDIQLDYKLVKIKSLDNSKFNFKNFEFKYCIDIYAQQDELFNDIPIII